MANISAKWQHAAGTTNHCLLTAQHEPQKSLPYNKEKDEYQKKDKTERATGLRRTREDDRIVESNDGHEIPLE